MEEPDRNLLQRFVTQRDERAFRALLERHLDLVHATAHRVTANDALARDVAQAVFIRLAQRAAAISTQVALAAWLHRTTRCLAIDHVRGEERRRKKHLAAVSQSSVHAAAMNDAPDPAWPALAPVIDELIDSLPEADRQLVLLRYYRNESHATIASRLGLTEATARKRSGRALEKLRMLLNRRGIVTTASALATLLPAHAAPAAPATLMTTVAGAVKGVAPLIAPGSMQAAFLAMNTTQKIAIAAAAAFFAASLGWALRPTTDAVAGISSPPAVPPATGAVASVRPNLSPPPFPATPEERLSRLDEILSIPESLRQRQELVAFIDSAPPALFAELADGLRQLDPNYDARSVQNLLLSAWTRTDGPAAMTWLRGNKAPEWLEAATLTAWAANDPDAALAASGSDWKLRSAALAGLAGTDLPRVMKELDALPAEERPDALFSIYSNMMDQPGALERLVKASPPGEAREKLLAGQALQLIEMQPEKALALLKDAPGALDKTVIAHVYRTFGRKSEEVAIASFDLLPPGARRNEAVTAASTMVALHSPADAFAMFEKYTSAPTLAATAEIVEACGSQNPTEALARLPKIADEALRNDTCIKIIQNWQRTGHAADAEKWIKENPLPEAVRTVVSTPPPVVNPFDQ